MRVTLSDEELDQARERGRQLADVNRNTKDTPAYQDQSAKVYKDEADAGFVMSVAECAVGKATGREYHGKVWSRAEFRQHVDDPDVGRNIEVRHVTRPHAGLVVRRKDVGTDKVLFLAYPDPATGYREIEVIGWLKADQAWELGKPERDYKRVDQGYLRREW